MQTARMAAAATKYRDYIWVAGGMTGEKKRPLCSVVECYNSNTNESTTQTARMAAAATKYRDYIWSRPLCSVVECYNSNTNELWCVVRSMQTARMAAAATKYRDYMWVAGGMTGEKKRPLCSVVECYNSNTNE
ncbi:unnamed protein product [Plutella xylostella]|uniref:(diamondback moth) hypothetical protein n=1 Tax=Plutella xylostella TaxID=51655 RepID=A0A8S4EG22_PLUXY|nr:unnamed protein product [Plutella xylostella]